MECLTTLKEHSSYVNTIILNNEENTIYSASDDTTIKIWSIESMSIECIYTMSYHTKSVNLLLLSNDNCYL